MATNFIDKRFQDTVILHAPSVAIFWGSMCASQRLFGSLNYYARRRGTFLVGATMVTTCSMMAHHLNSLLIDYLSSSPSFPNYPHPHSYSQTNTNTNTNTNDESSPTVTAKQQINYLTGLTVFVFTLLERQEFQTIFPSSVITIGAYAKRNLFSRWSRGSVVSTSPTATPAQRAVVNQIGRLHGCHHCGDRQLIGFKTFIADHMPPTKMAKEMNNVFWRRWFGFTVPQSLYPQCQSCFQLQGNAVRLNHHELIYHMYPRIVHLSPLIAVLLFQNSDFKALSDQFINGMSEEFQKWKTMVMKYLK